jgi:hypothetical protein
MKRELSHKIVGTISLVLLFAFVIHYTRPKKDYSKLMYDWFWTSKTHYSKDNNIVVLGDSRTYRGISTETIKSVFPNQEVLNLGYSSGGLNQYMFDVAFSVLDQSAELKIIVLGVTPYSLTEEARKNEHYKQELERPLADVIERNYINPYLSVFESIKFTDYVGNNRGVNYVQVFHKNGWVESCKIPENKTEALASYEKTFIETGLSQKSVNETLNFVSRMKKEGVEVYGFRPPSSKGMEKLEDKMSGFNENEFKVLFGRSGGVWIDIPGKFSFNSYDGSHLHYQSAKELSFILGKKIKNYHYNIGKAML